MDVALHRRKMLLMFSEPVSSTLSLEKHKLLVNYILVLTLFADDCKPASPSCLPSYFR